MNLLITCSLVLLAVVIIAGFGPASSFWWLRWSAMPVFTGLLGVLTFKQCITLDKADYCVLALVTYAGLSCIWAADGYTAVLALERLVLLSAIWFFGRRVDTSWVAYAALASASIILLVDAFGRIIPGIEHFPRTVISQDRLDLAPLLFGGLGNINDQTQVLLLALPLMMFVPLKYFWVRMVLIAVSAWTLFFLVVLTTSNMAKWAFLFSGSIGAALWIWRNKLTTSALMGVAVITAILYALYVFDNMNVVELYNKYVASHLNPRLQLWTAAIHMGYTYPVGVGFGNFDIWWPEFNRSYEAFIPWAVSPAFEDLTRPGAAHGDFIQAFAELGIVGFGLIAAIIAICWRKNAEWGIKAAVLIAISLVIIDFPLQKPATAFLITAVMIVMAGQPKKEVI